MKSKKEKELENKVAIALFCATIMLLIFSRL